MLFIASDVTSSSVSRGCSECSNISDLAASKHTRHEVNEASRDENYELPSQKLLVISYTLAKYVK